MTHSRTGTAETGLGISCWLPVWPTLVLIVTCNCRDHTAVHYKQGFCMSCNNAMFDLADQTEIEPGILQNMVHREW